MIEINYYEALKQMKNVYDIRKKIIEYAKIFGISAAANKYSTTRKTVRKWLNRYKEEGLKGLSDKSRAPKSSPLKIKKEEEEYILSKRKKHPYMGAERLKMEFNIKRSLGSIHRVIKEAGLVRGRKKKYKVKRDLREIKARLRAFEKMQVDIKELKDIPQYYPYILVGYPKYQFTGRDVRTGIDFISFGYEKSAINVGIFMLYLCNHLKDAGVDLKEVEFQSDNGSEFIGAWNKKKGKTPFESVIEHFKSGMSQIPPGRCTYNSDVEASHRLIEDEFYDMESYSSKTDFLSKAYTYTLYFNYFRKFRYKGYKSPIEVLRSTEQKYKYKKIANLKPIILDSLIKYIDFRGGYHLPISDMNNNKNS